LLPIDGMDTVSKRYPEEVIEAVSESAEDLGLNESELYRFAVEDTLIFLNPDYEPSSEYQQIRDGIDDFELLEEMGEDNQESEDNQDYLEILYDISEMDNKSPQSRLDVINSSLERMLEHK
jgi:hypothetical protein